MQLTRSLRCSPAEHSTHTKRCPEECDLDAVLVCTPPASHPEICLHFINQKRPCALRKAFCGEIQEATRVVDAARQNGVTITMASKFRYVDDVIKAKQIVDSGVLGDIILFENAFTARVDMSNRWNSDAKISGGGVLIDNGTHSVDIARYFLGPLAEVRVMRGRRGQNVEVEDTVQIFVRSACGIMGNIDLSWSINKELDAIHQHLRLPRHRPRGLERIEVPPDGFIRLGRLRQWLRQGRRVSEPVDQFFSRDHGAGRSLRSMQTTRWHP